MTARRFFLSGLMGGAAGLLLRAPAQAQSVTYAYDTLGRIISATYPNGRTTTYSYDNAGNRTRVRNTLSTSPSGPLAVTLSATHWHGYRSVQDAPIVVTVTGGTPPYSYAWQWNDGYSAVTATNPNSNTTVFHLGPNGYPQGFLAYASFSCFVTDAASTVIETENLGAQIEVL